MAIIIDGKRISSEIRAELAEKTLEFKAKYHKAPGLAVIIVGEDPASRVYVRNKHKACAEVGFYSEVHELPADATEQQVLDLIDRLNASADIHGILVQLPLPGHLDEQRPHIMQSKDSSAHFSYSPR